MPCPGGIICKMLCYRLFEDIPQRSSLGFGPAGGRWNHSGTPIIYCASAIALVYLELYCIRGIQVSRSSWILATLQLPEVFPFLDMNDAPEDWNQRPVANSTRDLGTTWALSQESLCLAVPSARIPLDAYPREHNLLINPLHPDFSKKVKLVSETKVSFAID